jgi:hypothetical protein
MSKEKVYTVDGRKFSDYGGFIAEFNRQVFGDHKTWSGNLDQFDDMLQGGFGTPSSDEHFTIQSENADKSRKDLGHSAMHER